METKDKIRNDMMILRNHLGVQEKHALSEQIMQNLMQYLATEEVKHILLYADFRNEVETKLLATYCLEHDISVYYPRVMGQDMEFLSVKSMTDLSPDFMGIREPAYDTHNLFQLHTSQVEQVFMVMPALAFDTNGNRIGYGKGYYDRYLTQFPIINRIGICYDFQITNLIPCTTQDIRATMVISEKRIIRSH